MTSTQKSSTDYFVHAGGSQAPRGDSQFRPTPTAKDLFLSSKEWQYGVTANDSRKYRLVDKRMKRLAKVLSRFDHTGACREIFPAVATILAKLLEAELNYPEPQRLTWSKATVFRYLKRIEQAGVMTRGGLSRYHGTRRRVLHPEALLSEPRESETPTRSQSETPTRRESETGSKSLDSKKLHESKRDKAAEPQVPPPPATDTRYPECLEYAGRTFEAAHSQKPTWGSYQLRTLRDLLAHSHVTSPEFQRRWQHYLDSTEAFTAKQGWSLAYFCGKFDAFLNGPLHDRSFHNGRPFGETAEDRVRRNIKIAGLSGAYHEPGKKYRQPTVL